MNKIEHTHQQVRTALICGQPLHEKEHCVILEAITELDTQIECSILEMESICGDLNPATANSMQSKLLNLRHKHIIFSDLVYWLKSQTGVMNE